jgi:hypothetical protein
VVCVATAAAVEFDTTGHLLKRPLSHGGREYAKASMKSSLQRSRKFLKRYNIFEKPHRKEHFFMKEFHVCNVMKRYLITYVADTLHDSTPVSDFVTWRDSSFTTFGCVGDSVVAQGNIHFINGRWRGLGGYARDPLWKKIQKVLEAWPVEEGYHPVFIRLFLSHLWFFHVPEVDPYNLTRMFPSANVCYPPGKKEDYKDLEYNRCYLNKPRLKNLLEEREKAYQEWKQNNRKEGKNADE